MRDRIGFVGRAKWGAHPPRRLPASKPDPFFYGLILCRSQVCGFQRRCVVWILDRPKCCYYLTSSPLSKQTGSCFAANKHFKTHLSSYYNERNIERILKHLAELKVIRIDRSEGIRLIYPLVGLPDNLSASPTKVTDEPTKVLDIPTKQPDIENKENKGETKTVSTPVAPTRNTVSVPKPLYNFTDHVWNNIPDSKVEEWNLAFPACDIELELRRMAVWLEANPTKRKSNYARFIANWLTKTQDKGGDKAWPKWKK